MIERFDNNTEKRLTFSLRHATQEDLPFLFRVSTDAMKAVVATLNPDKEFVEEKGFASYKDKFTPEKIQVIQFEGKDVGRLRVVRTSESIYIGGIQILPEFQGKGIGTALFYELIEESNSANIPITLEVHIVNESAISFYTNLGFKPGETVGNQTVMSYIPNKLSRS